MTPTSPTQGRIERARQAMAAQDLPALLVTQIDNVRWLSGFTGSAGVIVLTAEQAVFATDSRYTTQAAEQCPEFTQAKVASAGPDDVATIASELGVQRLGFDAGHLTYRAYELYRGKIPAEIELTPTNRLIEDLRMVKDADEVERIEAACDVAVRAFAHILQFIKPGVSERDVMLELEWFMRRQGGGEVAFDTIVASGPRSALPHGLASERVMAAGDFVTLDFGARVRGYCSDITRTVVIGEPTDEQRKVYGIVRDAMMRAIDGMKPGASGKEIDALARDFIAEAGYGDYFGHGLGHSIGRVVHDGPGFATRSEVVLAPGMILTVEPGIYIPAWGGVRIEHDVLVTEDGHRVMTGGATTDLLRV